MIAVIIFLLASLLLGIGFLLSYHKEVTNPEDTYKRDWKGFFWSSLRMMSLAVVTLFLFFVMLCFVGEDDPDDNLSWIGWFIVVTWFVSIPVLVIYVISVVQVIVHRQLHINKVFLGLHIINLLQVICVLVLAILPQKSCTPEAMETDYKAHQTEIKRLIAVTKSWLPDSTGFSVEYSKNGEITDWGVNSKVDVNFEPDNWVTDNVKNRELKKIGLSVERLDSIRFALREMDYRGLNIGNNNGYGDCTEIEYGRKGQDVFYYQLYDKPLTDSLISELNNLPSFVVFNRRVVFYCMENSLDTPHFPGKEAYLTQRSKQEKAK